MPMSSQREPALRWLAQAEQATTSAGAAECAGAALDCALRSGDWAMRGRAAGLVRRTAASASASAFSAADRPGAEGGGASAPRLGESLGIADAVGEHMAGAFSQRVHALGLPTYTGICITAEGTPLDCAARALQAGTALDASERQLRTGQSAAAMASATLGATQALRSGDAGLIGRADAQVLTAAGAVMELGSLDPGYEHAVVSAERGLHLMAAHRVAMAGPGRRAATRTVPAETSPSVTAPHPMGGDHG
jgi:hypothetical protein